MRLFLVLLFSLCLALPAAAGEPVKVNINGSRLATDVDPVIVEGRTMVPVRAISEGFGADVGWDGRNKQVTVGKSAYVVVLVINSKNALVNGEPVEMNVPPQIVNDRTMVPLRFIGDALGAKVDWDEASRTVLIEKYEVDGGLTPEQVLEKSMVAMDVYDSYRFKGNMEISVDVTAMSPAGGENMQMQMNMEGAFKKPSTVYMKMDATGPQTPEMPIKMEMWTDGSVFYMNDGSGWKDAGYNVPGQESNLLSGGRQDPASAMKMIKEYGGIVSFTRNDEDYYRVRVTLNIEKLFEQMFSGAGSRALVPNADKEAMKSMAEFFKLMKMRLMYDLKIHRGDFINESMQFYGDINMDLSSMTGKDGKMKMDMSGFFNLYDLNQVTDIPKPAVEKN